MDATQRKHALWNMGTPSPIRDLIIRLFGSEGLFINSPREILATNLIQLDQLLPVRGGVAALIVGPMLGITIPKDESDPNTYLLQQLWMIEEVTRENRDKFFNMVEMDPIQYKSFLHKMEPPLDVPYDSRLTYFIPKYYSD